MGTLNQTTIKSNSDKARPSLGKACEGTFHTSENIFEDGSATHDVYFSSSYGQELIAEPATQATAEYLAEALNAIRTIFLDCDSDREAIKLGFSINQWIERNRK